jgi:tRNA G18 (ribose-2'-O)-methylase SpoU
VGPVVEVSDPDDPRLADYRSLTDVSLRTSFEPPHGLFIAESALVIERAIAAGYRLRSAVMTPSWLDRTAPALAGSDAPVYLASDAVLRGLTGFHVHRGALASVHRRPLPDLVDLLAEARRVTVIEDVVSHTNLGAIFRTAAAFGIDGVVISPQAADPLYRRSVRVSMGGVFAVPYARATSWPGDLERIRAAGFTVVALTPAADSVSLREFRPPAGQRIALLVGTEGAGLSRAAIDASDVPVRIPMAAGVDSLNVATATGIALWELSR